MIFTELHNGQGLGNQLFVYIATRSIAKKLGQEFAIKNYHNFKAPKLLNLDWGGEIPKEYSVHNEYIHGLNSSLYNDHQPLSLTDRSVFGIKGNTELVGYFISEGYFHEYISDLNDWIPVNPKYEHNDTNDDNICVLNVRGGPHQRNSHVYPPRSYWDNAIKRMLEYNPDMKFIVVTDDVEGSKQILPEFECYHQSIETERQNPTDSFLGMWDYVALKNCKNIVCSTTTFACFPLWTNKNLKKCISPKYHFCMNHSDGWWCNGASFFSYVTDYMDSEGNLKSPEECKKEWKEYYLKHNIYTEQDLKNNYEF